jgi:thiol:disulfide interchange protein
MSQLKIQFIEDSTWQKKLLFPMSPSENQALLEALKTEYSQTWLSEVEKRELAQAIQDEKNRPIALDIYAK